MTVSAGRSAGRRVGVRFDLSLAVVPSWAPSGADGSRYGRLLEGPTEAVAPEVVAHHRDRWGHVESYDDFADLLDFSRFDAATWADLAVDAGAGFAIVVADGADGWRWWPSPGSDRRLSDRGHALDVAGALAVALRARGLDVGVETGSAPVDDAPNATAEVAAAVDHLGAGFVWRRGDGPIAAEGRHARPAGVVDHLPDGTSSEPWTIVRPVGRGGGPNRTRRSDHHLTGVEIVDLFTEVSAKGGTLVIDLAPGPDGTIPREQSDPLRDAGSWIRRHGEVLDRALPRPEWGDRDVRLLTATRDDSGERELLVIDVTRRGRVASLRRATSPVATVDLAGSSSGPDLSWEQDESGLLIHRRPPPTDFDGDRIGVDVYRLTLDDQVESIPLFPAIDDEPIPLAPLLAQATPGQIVRLGEATYLGPALVPDGVTVRGLGPERTVVAADPGTSTDGRSTIVLGHRSGVEHLTVNGSRTLPTDVGAAVCRIAGDAAHLLGCRIVGRVGITGDAASVRAVAARGIDVEGADDVSIARCELDGAPSETGIRVIGAARPLIDTCRADGHRLGVELVDVEGGNVVGCSIESGWAAISLVRSDQTHAHANRISRSVRAVDVVDGTDAVVDGNWVVDGDSGCVVRSGATGATVVGNRWERCRVGLFVWDVGDLVHRDNQCLDLDEGDAELVIGP